MTNRSVISFSLKCLSRLINHAMVTREAMPLDGAAADNASRFTHRGQSWLMSKGFPYLS
ncbi:hypothetical protein [Photobacterium indicum]|uniref:hypothetical protein n=1 Tax=Photobacterium indicum TaxID=81447 RepID=UPI001473A3F5|nr:hypothetical protein [Photobacterium indicum]